MILILFSCFTGLHSAICSEADCRSRVMRLIPAKSHTLVEIDHEIISTVIILGCCQLKVKVFTQSNCYLAGQACPGRSEVRLPDCLDMTLAVDKT